MTYLLDTNAISDLMRAAPRIENWLAGLDQADRVVTCTIIRGEILFGIARLPAVDGARSWKRLAINSCLRCAAKRSRNGQPTFTRHLSSPAGSAASRWTKTICG